MVAKGGASGGGAVAAADGKDGKGAGGKGGDGKGKGKSKELKGTNANDGVVTKLTAEGTTIPLEAGPGTASPL